MHPARHRSHAPQVRAAQPPVRSCCPPGSQSTFCDAHRVTTLPAQYRFLPALRHVEAFLTPFTATLTLTFTLTLSGTRARARARARTRGRILALALALTWTLTRTRTPSLPRHVKASAAFVARRFRWLVFVDDDSFVFPTHLHWHAPPHPRLTPASPPPHPSGMLCPSCTPLHTSLRTSSALPPHLLRTSSAPPLQAAQPARRLTAALPWRLWLDRRGQAAERAPRRPSANPNPHLNPNPDQAAGRAPLRVRRRRLAALRRGRAPHGPGELHRPPPCPLHAERLDDRRLRGAAQREPSARARLHHV